MKEAPKHKKTDLENSDHILRFVLFIDFKLDLQVFLLIKDMLLSWTEVSLNYAFNIKTSSTLKCHNTLLLGFTFHTFYVALVVI